MSVKKNTCICVINNLINDYYKDPVNMQNQRVGQYIINNIPEDSILYKCIEEKIKGEYKDTWDYIYYSTNTVKIFNAIMEIINSVEES